MTAIRLRSRVPSVLVLYAWELAVALIVATPFHGLVRATVSAHPDGDAALFQPGGRMLIALLGVHGAGVPVATRSTLAMLTVALVVLQLPLGALLASLVPESGPKRQRALFRDATGVFMPLSTIFVLTALLQVVVVGAGAMAAAATSKWAAPRVEDLRAFQASVAVFAVFAVVALLVVPLADLARAAVVRACVLGADDPPTLGLLREAARAVLRLPRRAKLRAIGAWAWRVGVGVVAVALVASIVDRGLPVVALWLLHQAVVLGRTFLRASWLAHASRAVADG